MESNLSKRQSEIIKAAIKLIGEGGIQALTIKNLSSEIGVAESAIYRHFKSKTEVLGTLLDFLGHIIISHYEKVSALKASSSGKIKKMISGQLKLFAENPPYALVILSDGLYKNEKVLHDKIFQIMQKARTTFISIIEEGQKEGVIRTDISSDQIAFVIMGSVRLTVNQWSLSGFSFDLQKRGNILFKTLITLIHVIQEKNAAK
jgi:TetR/AcrR family transcriptional regulator, fatty acid metabolism regulator protein